MVWNHIQEVVSNGIGTNESQYKQLQIPQCDCHSLWHKTRSARAESAIGSAALYYIMEWREEVWNNTEEEPHWLSSVCVETEASFKPAAILRNDMTSRTTLDDTSLIENWLDSQFWRLDMSRNLIWISFSCSVNTINKTVEQGIQLCCHHKKDARCG